jgi:cell division protein FtsB
LEFSFDRSNDYRSKNNSSNSAETAQGQTEQTSAQPAVNDGIDTSQITNERLRKAIERNRARQAERMRNQPQQTFTQAQSNNSAASDVQNAPPTESEQPSMFDRPSTTTRVRVHERLHKNAPDAAVSGAVVTRKSVARADEADFTPVKRTPRKVSSQISYSTSGNTNRKKTKSLDPKLEKYLVRGSWFFCAFLVLRLFFASGGIMDFYSQKSLYQERIAELDRIKKENMQIVREIERMQTDAAFQKKLVRDNLGFIASDEFLVLFPKEKLVQ